MKNKISDKLHNLEKKIVTILDKNKNGVVEPQEVLEVLTEVAKDVLTLKGLIKGL